MSSSTFSLGDWAAKKLSSIEGNLDDVLGLREETKEAADTNTGTGSGSGSKPNSSSSNSESRDTQRVAEHAQPQAEMQDVHGQNEKRDTTDAPQHTGVGGEKEKEQDEHKQQQEQKQEQEQQQEQERQELQLQQQQDQERDQERHQAQNTDQQPPTIATISDVSSKLREVSLKLRRREAECQKQTRAIAVYEEELAALKKSAVESLDELKYLRSQNEKLNKLKLENDTAKELLKVKDHQIAQVLEEGAVLSKKQAAMEKSVRSMRADVKAKGNTIAELREKNSEHEQVKERLLQNQQHSSLEQNSSVERLALLTAKVQELEPELARLRAAAAQHEAGKSESTSLVARLEAKIQTLEADDLNWKKQALDKAAAEAKLKQLNSEMQRQNDNSERRESTLRESVRELRASLRKQEQEATAAADELSHSNQELRSQLRLAQDKAQQLASAVPEATKPLLVEMKVLRDQYSSRSQSWKESELKLMERCSVLEADKHSLEAELKELKQEQLSSDERVSALQTELNQHRTSQQHLHQAKQKIVQGEAEVAALQSELEALRAEALSHTEQRQLALQRQKDLENSLQRQQDHARREVGALQHRLSELELDVCRLRKRRQSSLTSNSSLPSTSASTATELAQPSQLQPAAALVSPRAFASASASAAATAAAAAVAATSGDGFGGRVRFQAAMRHRLGEIAELKGRVRDIESERDSLSDEVVRLRAESTNAALESHRLKALEHSLSELRSRHETALELMGAQKEENDELKQDLSEVKELYNQQISELVGQIETLRSRADTATTGSGPTANIH